MNRNLIKEINFILIFALSESDDYDEQICSSTGYKNTFTYSFNEAEVIKYVDFSNLNNMSKVRTN